MMPSAESARVLLTYILDCIQQIQEYTGYERQTFFSSRLVQDAVVRNLQILAESTQRLSEPLKTTQQNIPWRKIAGFRNVLAHGYLGVDLEVVWNVVEHNREELADATEEMLLAVDADISHDHKPLS